MYQIQAVDTQRVCVNNLVAQKFRSLDAMAKLSEKISAILKKDFVHLGLEKKESKELQASLVGYIKVVSFTIYP